MQDDQRFKAVLLKHPSLQQVEIDVSAQSPEEAATVAIRAFRDAGTTDQRDFGVVLIHKYLPNSGSVEASPRYRVSSHPLGMIAQGARVLFLRGPNPGMREAFELLARQRSGGNLDDYCKGLGLEVVGIDDKFPEYACKNSIAWHYILRRLDPSIETEFAVSPPTPWLGELVRVIEGATSIWGRLGFCLTPDCKGNMTRKSAVVGSSGIPGLYACPVCGEQGWWE